jgi:carbamoyl-phosphate synthase small subunit
MAPANPSAAPKTQPSGATGVLVLADGTILWGIGYGAAGAGVGEICFNTAMTGYQEILTDPSYAGQIITFTFPHIGNVGANPDDMEREKRAAIGCVTRELPTLPSNFRSVQTLPEWMKAQGLIGLAGIDTRALTRRIRDGGAPTGVVAHNPEGKFDIDKLLMLAQGWPGLEGMDLAKTVTRERQGSWDAGVWALGKGYAASDHKRAGDAAPHVVAVDYGAKDNIFRNLVKAGARVTVVPAKTSLEEIVALRPAGVFLSNGPGDPAATGDYAVPVIKGLLERNVPIFGICLGHQLLGLAAGGKDGEDASGPSRREPSGAACRRRHRRDHQHEPRLCGRYRRCRGAWSRRTRAYSTDRTAASRSRGKRRSACNITPRRARGRRIVSICSRSLWAG